MGKRASVYLTDALYEAWQRSGVPLGELVRRGLDAGGPVTEVMLRRVLAEVMGSPAYATHGGTGVTEVPQSADVAGTTVGGSTTEVPPSAGTTVDGTDTTLSGTASAGRARKAARADKATARTETPAEPPAAVTVLSALPDLPAGLTVASALPKPQRCGHAGTRSIGGYCPECEHRVKPGGEWA